MNKQFKIWGIILLSMLAMLLPVSVQAEETQTRLFTLLINDSGVKTKVPVYEYRSEVASRIDFARDFTGMKIRGSQKVKIAVKAKSAYWKQNYKSVTVKKQVPVKTVKRPAVTITDKNGNKTVLKLLLKRVTAPKIKSIKLSSRPFSVGSGPLQITVNTEVTDTVTCVLRIRNSKNKIVYKKTVGSGEQAAFLLQWDGKPNKSVDSSLLTDDGHVKNGTYKIDAYLKYSDGTKIKKLRKTTTFKVKNPDNTPLPENIPIKDIDWGWTVISTGYEKLDYVAELICQSVLKPGMSEIDRAKALYKWIGVHFTYNHGKESYWKTRPDKIDISSDAATKAMKAYQKKLAGKTVVQVKDNYFNMCKCSANMSANWGVNGLVKQTGDCNVIAMCYAILCRHAGMEADVLEHLKQGQAGHHFWSVVKVNGKFYMADADRPVEGGNVVTYEYCLRGTNFMKKTPPYNSINGYIPYQELYSMIANKDCPGR